MTPRIQKHETPYLLFIILISLSITIPCYGMGTETVGSKNWERDFIPHPSRVYTQWVNGNERFYYQCDEKEIVEIINQFVNMEIERHEVIFRPEKGIAITFENKRIPFNLTVMNPSGLYLHHAKENQHKGFYTTIPQLTIYIDSLEMLKRLETIDPLKKIHPLYVTYNMDKILRQLTEGTTDYDRANGAYYISLIGPEAEPTIDTLVNAMKDQSESVRAQSARALGEIGVKNETTLRVLTQAKNKDSDRVRQTAAEALNKLKQSMSKEELSKRETLRKAIQEFIERLK